MEYYELVVSFVLDQELPFLKSYEFMSNIISRSFLYDERLKKMHKENAYKFYTFCGLYPIENDKIYKKEKTYKVNIRSLSQEFILVLPELLKKSNNSIKILSTEVKQYSYKPISRLITVSPAVATIAKNRYWTKEDGLLFLRERIYVNAIKKYKSYFKEMEEPDDNFIEFIQQTNFKPIKVAYKNTSLLGNKMIIGVKSDEISQKLAFTILGAGLLEKNSIGMGYCIAK
ncbi:CRISPR-associated endoribonuclease Cas6 [Thermoanaerobacterium thermosaccharolyticum]|uniref:CRISPR-associated endoribonuclease Cas6 n=1 Tax=Thermoanaerobacterium thermosaccharolyticum TaxID=1517 RepID=UPI0017802C9A|nr:CRISPR-associated endoribonuclease Cas6 [Thermoanaerobacterium thermosaccharolyticum]MBE0069909.1 CRISPR-associated endoribonuclease Cas6 [Thermoanaerobacterium thermosaccharolyticum]MBE0228037.1 CRISPR-associated endoribonuclease Cas6 [Thermoanaerobacterium thermosaccharolyticum]